MLKIQERTSLTGQTGESDPSTDKRIKPKGSSILAFDQDAEGDWFAQLSCGHTQHVRHQPPFQLRPWVLEAKSRATFVGQPLACGWCAQANPVAKEQ